MDDQATKQQRPQRQIAVKTSIAAIKQGTFIANDGWKSHIVQTGGLQVTRVNLIGVVVAKQAQSPMLNYGHAVLDDGSDNIALRSFSDTQLFSRVGVGDICLVIGRPREYGQEIYVVPEIIRQLDNPAWLSLRALELAQIELQQRRVENLAQHTRDDTVPFDTLKKNKDDMPQEIENHIQQQPSQKKNGDQPIALRIFGEMDVLRIIRNFDDGNGVYIEKVIDACQNGAAEQMIHLLLQKGDVFEIRPGIVKILE